MKRSRILLFCLVLISSNTFSQFNSSLPKQAWVDSVFNSLSEDQKIAQLMVVRLSTIDSRTKTVTFYDDKVAELITNYNIGGICLFQGAPVKQADMLNRLQSIAKTPVLICIDAEYGVGMRMDSVRELPHQMMLGAMPDPNAVYQFGQVVAQQCKRIGIQVNYAPVVDINNNPNNPVINDRSFGENKYKVALMGIQYMKGMQDMGVMACAKHFPGHGDVSVDSHLDLPVINKSMAQLDSLELYPFEQLFRAGIGSVMVAHLYVPAIDTSANRATSLSRKNITGLMRDQLGYNGLTFTDALEMQGVKKYFPDGAASVESLIAGNDMLCLPGDVPVSITKIKEAINNHLLNWSDVDAKCRKVLAAKYQYGLANLKPIDTVNITNDLNSRVDDTRRMVAENAITLLRKDNNIFFPLLKSADQKKGKEIKVAYVSIGMSSDNAFAKRMRNDYNADVFYFDYKQDSLRILSMLELIKQRYNAVVIGIHGYNRFPANNFGISKAAISLENAIQEEFPAITFVFGNPYAVKNFTTAKNLVACYEDYDITQNTAIDILEGQINPKGTLPVTVSDQYKYGNGITTVQNILPKTPPVVMAFNENKLLAIDSLANDAIAKGATPGCVVLVAKDGKIAYHKAFGSYTYDNTEPVTLESIYDMASVTKICATTLCVMKLYDQKKLDLNKTLGDYLPWVKGSNKENLKLEKILLHQAGLISYIPFYKETLDTVTHAPKSTIYSKVKTDSFSIRVAEGLFMRNDWKDTIRERILESKLSPQDQYIYSDNDFIFLGKIVEGITGMTLDKYVKKTFYDPLGLGSTGFKPRDRFPLSRIVPTEREKQFRMQLLRGDVHDPGSSMFGGVAGHAGLFSTAYELSIIMQMLNNGGEFNGHHFLNAETVKLFTAYHSDISRRGYGFDKPEKDNATRKEPYPCLSASSLTFGHTGYTGTCVWADPKYNLVFIFLSNRVNPEGGDNLKLSKMNVRTNIQEVIYKSLGL